MGDSSSDVPSLRRHTVRLLAALALAATVPAGYAVAQLPEPAPAAAEADTVPELALAEERLAAARARLDAAGAELARLRGEMYLAPDAELRDLRREERLLQERKDALAAVVDRRERELADATAAEAEARAAEEEAAATAAGEALPDSPTGIVLAPSTLREAAETSAAAAPAAAPAPGVAPAGLPRPATVTAAPDAAAIDGYLASKLSPLSGFGAVFVAEARRVGLDPRFLVAIAGSETSFGTYGPSQAIHNPFGLGPHMRFGSWPDAIRYAATNLAGPLYRGDGRVTIAAIHQRWAPVGASNDPTNLNTNWTRNVSLYYAEQGGDPAAPVFVGVPDPGAAPAAPYAPAGAPVGVPTGAGPAAAQRALEMLGTPHAPAGSDRGIDAAGLVETTYGQAGATVPASVAGQAAAGTAVEPLDLRAGDVVVFAGDDGAPAHVGLYVGGGQFVHAPGPGEVVGLASLYEARWALRYAGARRL